MALMRLFTGLELPGEVVRNLEALVARLRPAARIQWSPAANLHITTKFIGEFPPERLAKLDEALSALPPRRPIQVEVAKLGFFPNARAPQVIWCSIAAPGLDALAAETDEATAALGVAREDRSFSPHLTLARIKERIDPRPLQEAIAALPSVEFGRFAVRSFFLYQSQLRSSGSVYTKLAEFPFSQR
jgi:2'-5' RNA ligase